jgi:hypothetical protein
VGLAVGLRLKLLQWRRPVIQQNLKYVQIKGFVLGQLGEVVVQKFGQQVHISGPTLKKLKNVGLLVG